MFDTLTQSLQSVFKRLRGHGKLSEKNVKEALREVRLALLEADVQYTVAKDFIARVQDKCLGEEVLDSITPGQQITKRIHEELAVLLGEHHEPLQLPQQPTALVLLGLHGAGKTTTAGKLAQRWIQEGKRVLLAACDIRRPAAVEQLSILGNAVGADVVTPEPGESVPAAALRDWKQAQQEAYDVVIFDTGGRFQIDEELIDEVKAMREQIDPHHEVLVLDAAIGQESVDVAETFHRDIGLTGMILTKMDGDARGGAAISVPAVTHCPIHLVGTGERAEDLEPFHPERMASRILGMGDIVSLVEKAQEQTDLEEMTRLEERIRKNTFNLEDFLDQLQQMKKMGPLDQLLEMLPMGAPLPPHVKNQMARQSGAEGKKSEAIIQSMTPLERKTPKIINGRRRQRIAKGSGTEVKDVNELLKKFKQAQKMAQQFKKTQKRLLNMTR